MNTNQLEKNSQIDPALISLRKRKPFMLWQKLKMTFGKSDLDFQEWQKLESKKIKQNSSIQWRNN